MQAGCRGFESHLYPFRAWLVSIPTGLLRAGGKLTNPYADITQLVECRPYKTEVGSSSLSVGTNLWKGRLGVQQTNPRGLIAKETPMRLKVSCSEKN